MVISTEKSKLKFILQEKNNGNFFFFFKACNKETFNPIEDISTSREQEAGWNRDPEGTVFGL